ncbi:MAG: hypothetical protein ABH849_04375 [Nanoarchaeota archaeon]
MKYGLSGLRRGLSAALFVAIAGTSVCAFANGEAEADTLNAGKGLEVAVTDSVEQVDKFAVVERDTLDDGNVGVKFGNEWIYQIYGEDGKFLHTYVYNLEEGYSYIRLPAEPHYDENGFMWMLGGPTIMLSYPNGSDFGE